MKNLGFEFTADFPDDMIDEGEGDDWQVTRSGGRAMTQAIADLVKNTGLSVSELEEDLEHQCWIFTADIQGRRYSVRAYDFDDPKCLFVWGSSPWFKRWLNRRDHYFEYLKTVHDLLCGDPRFGSVEWIDLNHHPISPE